MKLKSGLGWILALCLSVGLVGCGGSEGGESQTKVEGLDKLGEIQVVAREEGSGTRSAFAQLADFEEGTKDLTREDAEITEDSVAMIQKVSDNTSAIGYVSSGSLAEESKIKTLQVNGVSVDETNGKYPLARSFYLAYSGNLSDVAVDFLSYVHTSGQEIVGKSYTTVAKSSTFLSDQSAGTIIIQGSTSVEPLMQELAAAYTELNSNADIQVTASDSTSGLNAAMAGNCDFGMASRDLQDYEAELLDYEKIAEDNIAVIVQEDNPLENISLDSLKKIYTGETKSWELI